MSGVPLFVAGIVVTTVVLLLLALGYVAVATWIWTRSRRNGAARLILIPLGIATIAVFSLTAMVGPLYLARASQLPVTLDARVVYALVGAAMGIGVVLYVARTAAGRRYAELGLWGRN